MYCTNCGNQLGEHDKFCRRCGTAVSSKESPVREPSQDGYGQVSPDPFPQQQYRADPDRYAEVTKPEKKKKPKKKRKAWKTILLVLAALFVIGILGEILLLFIDGFMNATPEPQWVKTEVTGAEDPGSLSQYLTGQELMKYQSLKSVLETGSDTGYHVYDDEESVAAATDGTIAFVNDYPYVGDIAVYFLYSHHKGAGGKEEFLFENNDRSFAADYKEVQPLVAEFAAGLSGTNNEKLLAICDFISSRAEYDESSFLAHSTYGTLIDGRGVCQGYSAAVKALCDEAGIPCYIIGGTALIRGEEFNHVWNVVQLEDGNWYELDLTWNDGYGTTRYYCIPSSKMAKDHIRREGLMTTVVPYTAE